jgi:MFS transporter, PPP family, 3-phenylpropionic acid transporter
MSFLGVMGMFIPFINVYFKQELGFNGRQIGLLAMVAPFMVLTVVIPVSGLADRRRWRIAILMAAIAGFGSMMFVLRLPQTFMLVVLSWLFTAMFLTPIMTLADSIIARMALRYELNYGSMRLWGSIGFALASATCGILWEKWGIRSMFPVVGCLLFFVLFLASRLEEAPARDKKQAHVSVSKIRHDHGLMVLLLTTFFVGVSFNMSIIFDGIYMISLGGSGLLIGMIFSMAAGGELPTMHYRDKIVGLLNGPKTFLLAYGLLLTAFLGYSAAWHPWMLLLTALVKGFGFGLFLSSSIPFISERVPESLSSTVQSFFSASLFGLAPLFAAPLSGEIYERFGPRAVFICASLFMIGAALIMLFAIIRGIFTEAPANEPLPLVHA